MNQTIKKIQESLKVFELTVSEQETLMYLLETRSKWPVSGLASELEMPRQTMNSILKSLVAKGLALETKQKGINYFNSNTAQLFARVEALHDTHKSAVRTISEFIDG